MSRILDELKQAEARRERALAGRGAAEKKAAADREAASLAIERQEIEASAAREAKARRRAEQGAVPPEASGKRFWPTAGAIAVAGIFAALVFYAATDKVQVETGAVFQLKLDRNLESFTQRLKENK